MDRTMNQTHDESVDVVTTTGMLDPDPMDSKKNFSNSTAQCIESPVLADGQHGSRVGSASGTGATLTFKDVCYKVKGRKGVKTILDNVSGYARPGEMVALMGASGAGKSTLLDILADRVKRNGKTCVGDLRVNGHSDGFKMKEIASYVMQDDHLHPALTVYESIKFSAKLKLPNMDSAAIEERVNEIIQQFGLAHIRDSLVGNALIRGVSGGERRRVSIAVEVVSHPHIIFLDEPTSGLDSAAAYNICKTLRTLAQMHHKTIIATIHQPSSEIYEMFDRVLLLARGRTAYFGARTDAPAYFAGVGFPVPEMTNPADHFLYITNVDFFEDKDLAQERVELMSSSFVKSEANMGGLAVLEILSNNAGVNTIKDDMGGRALGFFPQTLVLTHRTLVDASRNLGVYWVRLVMYIMMAVMFGLFWWGLSLDQTDVDNRLNVHFMCVAFLCFMAVAAVPAFIEDRATYLRERMNGTITVWPYVIANTLVSLPFVFLIALIFSAICYPMCDFHHGADHFFIYVTFLFLALLVAESMTVAVSAIIPHFIAALTIVSAMNGFMMVVGGVLVAKDVMPSWLQWTNYLSYQKYSYESIVYNDLDGQDFSCTPQPSGPCKCFYGPDNDACYTPGIEVLGFFSYESVKMWEWALVLIGMYVFFRLVFYFTLLVKGTRR